MIHTYMLLSLSHAADKIYSSYNPSHLTYCLVHFTFNTITQGISSVLFSKHLKLPVYYVRRGKALNGFNCVRCSYGLRTKAWNMYKLVFFLTFALKKYRVPDLQNEMLYTVQYRNQIRKSLSRIVNINPLSTEISQDYCLLCHDTMQTDG